MTATKLLPTDLVRITRMLRPLIWKAIRRFHLFSYWLFLLYDNQASVRGESIYDFTANTIDGNGVSLDKYR